MSATVWQVGPKLSRMQLEDRSCWLLWDLEERGDVIVNPPNGFGMLMLCRGSGDDDGGGLCECKMEVLVMCV